MPKSGRQSGARQAAAPQKVPLEIQDEKGKQICFAFINEPELRAIQTIAKRSGKTIGQLLTDLIALENDQRFRAPSTDGRETREAISETRWSITPKGKQMLQERRAGGATK